MMSAAQYYPKLLSIMGNVLRFLPAFVRMKELLEEGYVGELLVCEAQVWQYSPAAGVDIKSLNLLTVALKTLKHIILSSVQVSE